MQIQWTTQSQATDADGLLLEGAASFAAECDSLKGQGCPETENARLVGFEVVGRQESVMTAEVTDAMAEWLFNKTDAADFIDA